jgi:hypothetical protein
VVHDVLPYEKVVSVLNAGANYRDVDRAKKHIKSPAPSAIATDWPTTYRT